MIVIENVNNSCIAYIDNQTIHTKDYYEYCVSLIKKKLQNIKLPINIIFGNFNTDFKNTNKILRIDIQIEHTLVKEGGRGVKEKVFGNIKDENNKLYLVRIDNYEYFSSLDYVLEYSIPNCYNIKSCEKYSKFYNKIINISPLLYDINFDNASKEQTITLFSDNPCPRREKFYKIIKEKNINCKNINNCFSKNSLLKQYLKTKILINVHQTDEHHTLEELRILPALRSGVVIISEDAPLKEKIPYADYIIWSKYENLIDNIKTVQENYLYYYNKFFNKNLLNILKQMEEDNYKNLFLLET